MGVPASPRAEEPHVVDDVAVRARVQHVGVTPPAGARGQASQAIAGCVGVRKRRIRTHIGTRTHTHAHAHLHTHTYTYTRTCALTYLTMSYSSHVKGPPGRGRRIPRYVTGPGKFTCETHDFGGCCSYNIRENAMKMRRQHSPLNLQTPPGCARTSILCPRNISSHVAWPLWPILDTPRGETTAEDWSSASAASQKVS